MKSVAIIGASYLQLPLVEKAKEMGIHTLCFAWEEGAVCKNVVDEFFPISIVEKERILKVCVEKHIDGICTIASDVAAPTVAFVAERMGLIGNSYEAAVRANNKNEMRKAFIKTGVPCPRFSCVGFLNEISDYDWIRDCLEQHGRALIVKPADRSGSLGVAKVESFQELGAAVEKALSVSFCHEAMVEEFVEGREISVEFISFQGKHYPLQITDKVTTGAPHFVELEHHQPAVLSPEMFKYIYSITEKALTALGLTNGASHSEYRITDDGRIVVMEIGGRMGGDFIGSDLVRLSTGYDFVKGVIEVALGEFVDSSVRKVTTIHCSGVCFLCEETRHLLPKIQDSLAHPERYPEIVRSEITDEQLRPVTCSADRSGYFIVCDNQ